MSGVVFDRVSVVARYGALTEEGLLNVGLDSPPIGADVRAAVERVLAPTRVTWVGNISDVIGVGPDLPTYEDVGPVLTVGPPTVDGDHATITTELWCGGTCGAGGTYTLDRGAATGWLITGMTGPQWIA